VGDILAQTILLETGSLERFASVGDYCSYSRMVSSSRWSNGKKKGENNTKCGNRYLAWAYGEAAVFASRYYEPARRFVERKSASGGRYLGLKALAHKLCRASYYVMREPVDFDPNRLFGSVSGSGQGNPECPLAKSQVS
jgi:transposase